MVTGAASGIGRASAEALVADGRKVALWDIAQEVTEVADGLGMPGAVVDVCDSSAMEAAIESCDRGPGRHRRSGARRGPRDRRARRRVHPGVVGCRPRTSTFAPRRCLVQLLLTAPRTVRAGRRRTRDRRHRQHRRAGRQSVHPGLLCVQGGPARPDPVDGSAVRAAGHSDQRRMPGLHTDADAADGIGHRRSPRRFRAGGAARPDRSTRGSR